MKQQEIKYLFFMAESHDHLSSLYVLIVEFLFCVFD